MVCKPYEKLCSYIVGQFYYWLELLWIYALILCLFRRTIYFFLQKSVYKSHTVQFFIRVAVIRNENVKECILRYNEC